MRNTGHFIFSRTTRPVSRQRGCQQCAWGQTEQCAVIGGVGSGSAAHNAVGLAGESPVVGIDCLPKSIDSSPLAAVGPLIILSWPESLNASRSRRACRMAIRRNACSLLALPDFPEFAQAVGYGVPGTPSHDRVLGRFNTLLQSTDGEKPGESQVAQAFHPGLLARNLDDLLKEWLTQAPGDLAHLRFATGLFARPF